MGQATRAAALVYNMLKWCQGMQAGTVEPEIVRGDSGSTEVVVIADRVRWMESACAQDQSTRSAELAGLIKQQHEALLPR